MLASNETSIGHVDYSWEKLIDEKEAAEFLGFTRRAMQNWRFRGGGPPFIKLSERSVRYRVKDLIAWIDSRKRASTSDT